MAPRSTANWLLPQPQLLFAREGPRLLDGRPLRLLAGPEWLECGWWDGGLVLRNYFIDQAASGALVWVYRQRLPLAADEPGWFLQGLFACRTGSPAGRANPATRGWRQAVALRSMRR